MNIKNKKGFTLVELLAVTIILIVIIFLAFTKIKGSSQKSKKNSIKASAISYVKAVNGITSVGGLTDPKFKDGLFTHENFKSEGLKLSGEEPDKAFFILDNFEASYACVQYGAYYVVYENGSYSDTKRGSCSNESRILNIISDSTIEFDYTGNYQEFTPTISGMYKVELWGSAGSNNSLGGKGAYTSGIIKLTLDDTLYIYVGQNPNLSAGATFNGGGGCSGNCTAGGGATDVRLENGSWNNINSLASRIMVAAGGAGYNTYNSGYKGGSGGTITGLVGQGDSPTTGGTQVSGGISYNNVASRNGAFGIGGYGDNWGGGGSGGYYGGAGGQNSSTGNGGSSGSSYISGHPGCIAIKSSSEITPKEGCEPGTTDVECSYHYSGKKFINTVMKSGNESMPTFDGLSTMTGNSSAGHARISLSL